MTTEEILAAAQDKGGDRFPTPGTLHVTNDGRAVGEDDPEGRFVLVGAGGSIPLYLAAALDLLPKPADDQQEPEPVADEAESEEQEAEPVEQEAEEKMESPALNKAVVPQQNKAQPHHGRRR